jgi:uncharacterized protein YjbJ (UPF0337 family)
MSDLKKKFENIKDKAEGEILENVGKVTGNEEMELKGKLKKKVVESKEAVSDLKNDVIGKMNDKIDATDEVKKL